MLNRVLDLKENSNGDTPGLLPFVNELVRRDDLDPLQHYRRAPRHSVVDKFLNRGGKDVACLQPGTNGIIPLEGCSVGRAMKSRRDLSGDERSHGSADGVGADALEDALVERDRHSESGLARAGTSRDQDKLGNVWVCR